MDFFVKTSYGLIKQIENKHLKKNLISINVGDLLRIGVLIQEGDKERIQFSEGIVISKHNSNLNSTITIRKTLQNVGVERIYLIHSPKIINFNIIKRSKVRRSKLYYLRSKYGKATRLKQKFM